MWILLTDYCSLISAKHLLNFRDLLASIGVRENTGGHTYCSSSVRLMCKCSAEQKFLVAGQKAMLGTVEKEGVQKSAVSH